MMIGQHLSPKTLAPQRQLNTIRRSHLIELLYQGIQQKVTTITAPPGSGKTTVVTEFSAEADIPVCWYTINGSDKDARSLLEGLIAAFNRKFPQIGQTVIPVLESSLQPEKQIDSIIDTLSHKISLNIHEYLLFVIEDIHILEDEVVAKGIISHLIEMSPENCHFIITSRNPVTLPVLPKLGLQQQVMRINTHEFEFSLAEIKELFATVFSTTLSEEQAATIAEETNGWVPALFLHAISDNVTLKKGMQYLNREDLYTYLAEEVYQLQPVKTQEFLTNTAILDELVPEFCDTLLDIRNSSSVLEELYIKNLFITRFEDDKPNYRFQTVFKDFLLHQLEKKNPEHRLVLHYKAGLIFEKEQKWDEAIQHFIKAHKPIEASRIILSTGEDYIRNDKWSVVLSWLELLPKSQVITSAELLLLKAAALVHLGDSTEAARILTELLDKKAYGSNALLQVKLLNWRCAALRMMGQFGEAKRDIKYAIALLKVNGGPSDVKGDVFRRLGDICAEQGQFKGALRQQQAALKYYSVSQNLALTLQVHDSLGIIFKRCGDLGQAIYHLENARAGWQKINNYGALSATLNNIGIIYQRKGQYEMALDTLQSGLKASKKHGYRRTEACLLLTTGEVLRDAGQYKDALVSFQQGLDVAREVMEPYFVTYALLGMGEVERLLGNIDKAAVLLNEAYIQAKNHGQPYETALIKIQIALIANENSQTAKTVQMLNECRIYLAQAGDKDALVKVYFYLAHMAFLDRQYDEIPPYIDKLEKIVREIGGSEFLIPDCKHAILMLQYCVNKKIGTAIFPQILDIIKRSSIKQTLLTSPVIKTTVHQTITSVNVRAFGEIKVAVNDREVREEEWRSLRAKEIFIYLLSIAAEQTREQVATALWPNLSSARGTSNFHINLYRARQAIMPVIFSQDRGKYRINPAVNISFDLFLFQELIKLSIPLKGIEKVTYLEKATALYHGPFAREIYGDWVEGIRQVTENDYIKALRQLTDLYTELHEDFKAIATLEQLINVDRYDDDAYGCLMELQLAGKDSAGANRTYQQYCRNVVQETKVVSTRVNQMYQKLAKNYTLN